MTGRAQELPASTLTLLPHPADPAAPPICITACWAVAGSEDGPGLLLRFALCGDLGALLLPAPVAPGPADGLWRHTCLEAFLAVQGEAAYREFNFSPSGQWAAYRFSGERARDLVAEAAAPAIAPEMLWDMTENQADLPMTGHADTAAGAAPASAPQENSCDAPRHTPDEAPPAVAHPTIEAAQPACALLAWLPARLLPRPVAGQTWLLGLSAVIETTDVQRSHWALRHPAQRPDFHHRDGWLPQPGLSGLLASALPDPRPFP